MNTTPPYLPSYETGCHMARAQHRPLVCWVDCHDHAVEAAVPEAFHCWEASMEGVKAPAVMVFTFVFTESTDGRGELLWLRTFEGMPTAAAIREVLGLRATP